MGKQQNGKFLSGLSKLIGVSVTVFALLVQPLAVMPLTASAAPLLDEAVVEEVMQNEAPDITEETGNVDSVEARDDQQAAEKDDDAQKAVSNTPVKSVLKKSERNAQGPSLLAAPEPNTICSDTDACQYATVAAAADGVQAGETVTLKENQTVSAKVTFNRAITFDGEGHTLTVSGAGHRLDLRAGVTLKNVKINKTDNSAQNVVFIGAPDVVIDNVDFTGRYLVTAGETATARALEISASNFLVKNSTFSNLRQPAYINGVTGTLQNNLVSVSRGWVVTGDSNVTFTGNTWSNNDPNDIAVIDDDGNSNTPAVNNYPCDVMRTITANNNGAVIDNQLLPRPCAPVPAASTTEVVRESNLNGWVKLNDAGQGGAATFQTGPAVPPAGTGSVELTAANAASDFALANYSWAGTYLKDIALLKYSSYKKSGASGPIAFALNFDTDITDQNTAWQGRLTYEPTYANTVTNGQWQSFDNMLTDRAWWFSNGGVKTQLNCEDTIANLCTFDQIVAKFPKSGIRVSDGAVLLRVDGSWTDYKGNVDAFTLASGERNVTYDFENEIPDTTRPTVELAQPAAGAINPTQLVVNAQDNKALNRVTGNIYNSAGTLTKPCSKNSNGATSDTLTCPIANLADGTYSIRANAADTAGNTSQTITRSFIIDTTAPTSVDDLASLVRGTVTIKQTITDNGSSPRSGKLRVWKLDQDGNQNNAQFYASAEKNVDNANVVTYSLNTTGDLFGDGQYIAKFTSWDKAGNSSVQDTPFTVDNTRPTATLVTPVVNSFNPTQLTVEAEDNNGLNRVTANIYNEANTTLIKSCSEEANGAINYTLNCQVPDLADGVYTIRANASDSAGSTSATTIRQFTVDTAAPTTPVNGMPNEQYLTTNEFDFTWDASTDTSNPVTYEFQSTRNPAQENGVLTNDLWKSETLNEAKIHSSGAPDGTWYWQVRATDAAGNKSAWSQIWNVTLDTQKPVVEITNPTANQKLNTRSTNNRLTISGTAKDDSNFNYYYCYVTTTGGGEVGVRDAKCQTAWAAGTPSKTAFADSTNGTTNATLGSVNLTGVADGNYTVHVVAKDKAGNTTEATQDFVLDNTRPTVELVTPTVNSMNPTQIVLNAEDTNELNKLTANIYDEANVTLIKSCSKTAANANSDTLTCPIANLADGVYTIRANASDKAGNTSQTITRQFTIDTTTPVTPETPTEEQPTSPTNPTEPGRGGAASAGGRGSASQTTNPNQFRSLAFNNGTTAPATTGTVLGDSDGNGDDDEGDILATNLSDEDKSKGDVRAATDDKSESGCFEIFGICWYWWLAVIALVVAILSYIYARRRRMQAEDSAL